MPKDTEQDTKDIEVETDESEADQPDPDTVKSLSIPFTIRFMDSLLMGPVLAQSIRTWVAASQKVKSLPVAETADVVSAVVRRFIAVGTLGMVLALIAIALLVNQNALLTDLKANSGTQVEKLQEQINAHQKEVLAARRSQASAAVYSASTDLRSKAEAVRTFVKIERDANRLVNLSRANLAGTMLAEEELIGSDLSEALMDEVNLKSGHLWGASLRKASLKGAKLSQADFRDADLCEADFTGADMAGAALANANLTKAVLQKADLWRADLRVANLRAADLREANLDRADLRKAMYNKDTQWPEGFDPQAAGCVLKED